MTDAKSRATLRPKTLSPGRLNLTVGIAAIALAAIVTLGSAAAGDPVARIGNAPGLFLANRLEWAWPGIRRDWQQALDLPTSCNLVVLALLFFAVLRRWAFRRRQG
jgi:hypothetical protein